MGFVRCAVYAALLGVLNFVLGRLVPKRWFDYRIPPYRTRPWEDGGRVYERLFHISAWQARVPDMSRVFPKLMPPKKLVRTDEAALLTMLRETCVAESCHVLLIVLGLGVLPLWPSIGGVLFYLIYAVFGNLVFVLIQRYNRPRLARLYERLQQRKEAAP